MFGFTWIQIVWYFLIYSFLGWCLEVAYCSIVDGKVINRGFLNGPVCPIYGFGMLTILFLLRYAGYSDVTQTSYPLLFFGGMVLSTLLELIGGWALLKLFHTRWWDYTNRRFNYKGYICLQFSLAWGLGGVFAIKVLHKSISNFVESILFTTVSSIVLLAGLTCVLIADFTLTVFVVAGLNKKLQELDEYTNKMRLISNDLSEFIGTKALDVDEKISESKQQADELIGTLLDKTTVDEKILEKQERVTQRLKEVQNKRMELKEKYVNQFLKPNRLLKAFPNMSHTQYDDILKELKEFIQEQNAKKK